MVWGEQRFFHGRSRQRNARGTGVGVDWYGAFAELSRAGLGDFDRIGRFTERQLIGLLAAVRKEKRQLRAEAIEDRVLVRWDIKAAQSRIKELRKE